MAVVNGTGLVKGAAGVLPLPLDITSDKAASQQGISKLVQHPGGFLCLAGTGQEVRQVVPKIGASTCELVSHIGRGRVALPVEEEDGGCCPACRVEIRVDRGGRCGVLGSSSGEFPTSSR